MQTRVDDKIAVRFKKVASARGLKPYAYLQQIIADAAQPPEPNTWKSHWERIAQMKLKPARKTFSEQRAEDGER